MTLLKYRISHIIIVGLLVVTISAIAQFQPQSVQAKCWPHYHLNEDKLETTVPDNGGWARMMARVRGMAYPWYDAQLTYWCTHGEANSHTEYQSDYIFWYGEFHFGTDAGPTEELGWGIGDCFNCTGGYWASQANWIPGGLGVWGWAYGSHLFENGNWSWQTPPRREASFPYLDPF